MNHRIITCILSATLLTACNMHQNPFLTESPLPYGAPQFDKIQNSDYLPAFQEAFRQGKQEIDAIVANPDAPTFQNTIEALEFSGSLVNKVGAIFYNLLEADATPSSGNRREGIAHGNRVLHVRQPERAPV